jgi:uncharacterized repeat protein (TIGR01451 family)
VRQFTSRSVFFMAAAIALTASATFLFCSSAAAQSSNPGSSSIPPGAARSEAPSAAPFVKVHVNQSHAAVKIETVPGTAVTVTQWRSGTAINTQSQTGESFGLSFGDKQIEPGDIFALDSSLGITASIDVIAISGAVNATAETISGHVHAPTCPANIRGEVWSGSGTRVLSSTNASCDYTVPFSPYNVHMADQVALWYVRPDGHEVGIVRSALKVQVDLDDDRVYGAAAPGATVQVTVTGSAIKVASSQTVDANGSYDFRLAGNDVGYNNLVTVTAGANRAVIRTPVTLTAQMDPAADTIKGMGPPSTHVYGNVWGANTSTWADTDVAGRYTISASLPPFNLNLLPTDMGQVQIEDAEGQLVYTHFGAYQLWANMNSVGQAAPGGRFQYEIWYGADRGAPAVGVVITDTLPAGVTYVGNNRGFPATVVGNKVSFNIGFVHSDDKQSFQVTVEISSGLSAGATIHNEAVIGVGKPDNNPDDNTSTNDTQLVANATDLNIGQNGRTGDPAAGQPLIFQINYNNQGSTGSSVVRITDTLPLSATYLDWWANEGGWTLVQTRTQVVFQRDIIAGNQGNQLYLVVQLDPRLQTGQAITNTAQIYTPNDTNAGNNSQSWYANVGNPRRDMRTDKYFNSGSTVPGGQIRYGLNYNNNGNMTAHNVLLTDTLPPGVTLVQAGYWTSDGKSWTDMKPTHQFGNNLVWDLGTVIPGAFGNFEAWVQVDGALPASTVLTNTLRVSSSDDESTPVDNASTIVETIRPSGPNLRVSQSYDWNYYGNIEQGQLHYRFVFQNVGNETLNNVWITDVLPAGTSLNGGANMGFDGSRVISSTTSDNTLRWQFSTLYPGDSGNVEFYAILDDPHAWPAWFTNTATIDTPPGDSNPADNAYSVVAYKPEVNNIDLYVGREHSNAWGNAVYGPGERPVTITTAYTRVVAAARPPCNGCWNMDDIGPVQPGDTITVEAGIDAMPLIIHVPAPYTAQADSTTNRVYGQVGGAAGSSIWVHLGWLQSAYEMPIDAAGNYSLALADVPRGGQGEVRYITNINGTDVYLHREFVAPDMLLRVNYGHDWVEGNYQETGHTVWITVTNALGFVKARATVATEVVPWWNGNTGFSTNDGNPWMPSQPDIVPGDWVYARMDNGQQASVRIGTLTGAIDPATDSVSGTVQAPWYTQTLYLRCESWGAPGGTPSIETTVGPNGYPPYSCSWAGQWDIPPGNWVGVFYQEPDGDQVGNAFRIPVSNLRINTYAQGNPGVGGNLSLRVEYWNDGSVPAENVVITSALQSLGYLGDNSGFAAVTGTGYVRWNLGSVPANSDNLFYVWTSVAATQGQAVTDTVRIATSNPYDTGNPKQAQWNGTVQANDTRLTPDLGAWTGDPAPGYDTVLVVNVCNKGSTGSSLAVLTDTLHPSMTVVSWWSQYPGWTQVISQPNRLVLQHPTIDGQICSAVYVRAHLSPAAWPGMQITNTAAIGAANETTADDNTNTWYAKVNSPHGNLNVKDEWNWGTLVPGGALHYGVSYGNAGNIPISGPIRITFTLPVSTTFRQAAWQRENDSSRVTPVFTGTGVVVFQINGLDNGYGDQMDIVLDVASGAAVGTRVTSIATISLRPGEDSEDDNISAWYEQLYTNGPNVRVSKNGQWDNWGENTRRASFRIKLENVGDVAVQSVLLTDTYPANMRLDGGMGLGFWRWWDWKDNPGQHSFTVALELLEPGWRVDLNAGLITDTQPLPFGLSFTNTAKLAIPPGDVNPADNTTSTVFTTGPDLFLNKTLAAGNPKPGGLITFSVRFGNGQPSDIGWWATRGNVVVTDTLPAGLSFVAAYQRFCGSGAATWCERGPDVLAGSAGSTHLVWNSGQIQPTRWNEFYIVARITDTAALGTVLLNQAVAASTQPADDVEPIYSNNTASYALTVASPRFVIAKVYQGSRIAGTRITYTLSISNTGNQAATHVAVRDDVPALVTFGGGGSYAAGAVTWNLLSIAPASKATAQFTGTLQCTVGGNVLNQSYRVIGNDQDVTSTNGAAVSFSIVAPTIDTSLAAAFTQTQQDWPVTFTATATTNGSPIGTYVWNFGDGTTITAANRVVAHAFMRSGTFVVSVAARDGCGMSSATAPTRTIVVQDGAQIGVAPGAGGVLTYTNAQGNGVAVALPGNAVAQGIELHLTPLVTATGSPAAFQFAGSIFELVAYQNGQPLGGFQFNAPVTVTVYYSDAGLGHLAESTLQLYYWNGSAWVSAAVGAYTRDPVHNWISVPIQHLTRFALFGKYRTFMPIVRK